MSTRPPPAAETREQYAQSGVDRYDNLSTVVEEALSTQNIDTETATPEQIAAAIAAYVAARQLSLGLRPGEAVSGGTQWIDDAVEQAYRDGITDARAMLREAGVALDQSNPTARLNQPRHSRALDKALAAQRQEWRTLAADLQDDIERAVREAARAGADRDAMVARVRDRIENVGEYRAELIGDNESADAYHRASLEEYRLVGVTEVEVDWLTQGDRKVCARCRSGSAASPYSLEEAQGLLPHHPRCRCWFEPNADSLEGPRR